MTEPSRRPDPSEYPAAVAGYVSNVPELDALPILEGQVAELRALLAGLTAERETFRYAPGKWSFRELAGHLADGERVFGYRAFCFSRGEQAELPAFEENDYVANAGSDGRTLADLLDELETVRRGNVLMFRHLAPGMWDRSGVANGKAITVRALAFAMAGHFRHHLGVLSVRYLAG